MKINLILDGNYLLQRNVFSLHKNNLLYGALETSLEMSVNNYRQWFGFENVYFVSDSKEKSWRKQHYNEYKGNRKKDTDIDWEFVYNTYDAFKANLASKVKILEYSQVEGDDWISYIAQTANKEGISNLIVSNDYDIKQLIKYELDPLWINIMSNEVYTNQKIFLPENYQIFLDKVKSAAINNDIFTLSNDGEFLGMVASFMERYEVNEVNATESLVIKLISGDAGDNILSVWALEKNGKRRGIGGAGAKSLYDTYELEFGDVDINADDFLDNIADLICEKKKLVRSNEFDKIKQNLELNYKIINLSLENIPQDIINKMKTQI